MRSPKRLIPIASADEGDILSRDASQAIIEKAVKMSQADAISVNVSSSLANNIRFAANQVSTAGSVADANVAVTS
jgi:predicted Zn-dependent protease